ncbi:DUF3558 domain-containing protein [Tomitella cavernea]|uniref:DUF3558 domain-containing protein n=1 Tax=Tomitella cavernea TaxID=1387982 RepID=A0ABP9C9R7_9ACTN|nr:DUF3558 domain-containing protein [Tomitella cavernea]
MNAHLRPPRTRRAALAVHRWGVPAVLAACLLSAGCTQAIPGEATVARAGTGPAGEEYVNLLRECTVVPTETIAEAVGVLGVYSTFSGAVCRWVSLDGDTDVQLNWFESGTVHREKAVAERLGYTVEAVRVAGASAYVMRPPDDPASCGAVARAGESGVVGWWVHGVRTDPCAAARKLVELSINRAL